MDELIEITTIHPQKELTISQIKTDFNASEVLNTVQFIYNHNVIDNRLWIRIYVNQVSSDNSTLLLCPFDIFYQSQTTNNLNEDVSDVIIYFKDTIRQFEPEFQRISINYNLT